MTLKNHKLVSSLVELNASTKKLNQTFGFLTSTVVQIELLKVQLLEVLNRPKTEPFGNGTDFQASKIQTFGF